ncbi:MAG: hypothetical protein KKD38_02815, partial [Candidatus Delongbacteria bacterium]|nr:hypothetical protein [Candidatus Delongbacteria bacterium]
MFDELFKILVYSKTNIGNCREFITEYVKNPNFFVAFLGSGINTPLQNVPNWKDLFFKLREKYCPNLQLITENEITPEDFSNIYKEVEDRENFDEYVINSVKPKGTYCTGTSWQLSRAFNNFITTNYYEPVEKAFKDCYSKEKRALKRFNMLTDLKIISENRLKDTI